MKKIKTLLLLFFSLNLSIYAQEQQIDSLENLLKTSQSDTVYIDLCMALLQKYLYLNPPKSVQYAKNAIAKSQEIGDPIREIRAYERLGFVEWELGNFDNALKNYKKSLFLAQKNHYSAGEANGFLGIASVYVGLGNHGITIEYYHKALHLFEKVGQTDQVVRSLNNLGWQYVKLDNYDSAMFYLTKAIPLAQQINSPLLSNIYDNIGELHFLKKDYEKALPYLYKSLGFCKKFGNKRVELTIYRVLGEIDLEYQKIDSAEYKIRLSLEMAVKLQSKRKIYEAYYALSKIMFLRKNFEKAYVYKDLYVHYNDSVQNQSVKSALSVYDHERREDELAILRMETEKQLSQRNWIIFSVVAGFLTLLVITVIVFYNHQRIDQSYKELAMANENILQKNEEIYQQKEEIQQTLAIVNEQKSLIEKKNTDITASITYALRIQNAILPKEVELQKHLDCFVFFRPKDIVSGDFYWFAEKVISDQGSVMSEKMPLRTTDHSSLTTKKYILAVADCTGHGVSGAFMTMIGNNILNQIVHDHEIHEPDQILNLMSPILEKTLLHSEGKVTDGMDISILTIERNTISSRKGISKISYAGAMNPLYYIENQEFKEIKADKIPIGGKREENFSYQKHELIFDAKFLMFDEENSTSNIKNPTFYLCSDGFQDQFGGDLNKKFMVGNFKKLLSEISGKPMAEQKQILEKTYEKWKGEHKPTDDVLVLGVRL